MPLYFVADAAHGENRDLFVNADTPDEAAEMWRGHYVPLDFAAPDETPERVFAVPTVTRRGVVEWHSDDLKQIGGSAAVWPD